MNEAKAQEIGGMPEDVDLVARRRAEILRAALKIISKKGYQNFGIADIAADLCIGHGTFYRYYENKQDVALAVLEEVIRRITRVVLDIPASGIDTLDQYRERNELIGKALFNLVEEDPYIAKWISYEGLSLPAAVTDRIQAAFELFATYTEAYIKNGIEKGFLREDIRTRETARAVNSMMFEAAKQVFRSPVPREAGMKAWSETIIGLMLDCLAAE